MTYDLKDYTLPPLVYNFKAITHTDDQAHNKVLTIRMLFIIAKISLERQFLRKTIKRKVFKIVLQYLSTLLLDLFHRGFCSVSGKHIALPKKYYCETNPIVQLTNTTYRTILSILRLTVFLKNCLSKEILAMWDCFQMVRTSLWAQSSVWVIALTLQVRN